MNDKHLARTKKHKEIVDARIAAAQESRGVVLVHTGNGKGKSSSAFGLIARALGHGMSVGVVQFIKASNSTGEELFFKRFPEVEYHIMGEGFTWETQNRERDIQTAAKAWDTALTLLQNPNIGLVVLDEINIAIKLGYLEIQAVLTGLQQRPVTQHVVLTGRGALPELIEFADTVTEMNPIKHAFDAGIVAQKGVEL